jgi:hypothetical protein
MLAEFWKWLGEQPASSASFLGTLTGSSLGLIALLLGALFNARLNRRRDNDLRDAERIAIASALHAELQGMHHQLVKDVENLKELPLHKGYLVPKPLIKILPEVLPKIGLLRSNTVHAVIEAYGVMEQYVGDLILIGGKERSDMPDTRQMVCVSGNDSKSIAEFTEQRAEVIKAAIDCLAPYIK